MNTLIQNEVEVNDAWEKCRFEVSIPGATYHCEIFDVSIYQEQKGFTRKYVKNMWLPLRTYFRDRVKLSDSDRETYLADDTTAREFTEQVLVRPFSID